MNWSRFGASMFVGIVSALTVAGYGGDKIAMHLLGAKIRCYSAPDTDDWLSSRLTSISPHWSLDMQKYSNLQRKQVVDELTFYLTATPKWSPVESTWIRQDLSNALWSYPTRKEAGARLEAALYKVSLEEPQKFYLSTNDRIRYQRAIDLLYAIAASAQDKPRLVAELNFEGAQQFKAGGSLDITLSLVATNRIPKCGSCLLQSNDLYLAKLDLQAPNFITPPETAMKIPRDFAATNPATWTYSLAPTDKALGWQTLVAEAYVKTASGTNEFRHGPDLKALIEVRDGSGFPPWCSRWLIPIAAAIGGSILTALCTRWLGPKKDDAPANGPLPSQTSDKPAVQPPQTDDDVDNPS